MKPVLKTLIIASASLSVLLCAGSCAREKAAGKNDSTKRYFDAWMSVNHPDLKSTARGIYILEDKPGTGAGLTDDDVYIFLDYTTTDLEGTVLTTSYEKMARQIGTWSSSDYYGPAVFYRDPETLYAGLRDAVADMRIGGERTVIIPGWLCAYADYKTEDEFLRKCTGDDGIYSIKLVDKASTIRDWEVDTLQRYVNRVMDRVDSTGYGFYYKTLVPPADDNTITADSTIYVTYIGRLLNGHVFDTNIADTAKFYGLYDRTRDYSPMAIIYSEELDKIRTDDESSESESSLKIGFRMCIQKMKKYERARCAFISDYGYESAGSGTAIPSFAPLVFDVELVDAPAE